MLSPKLECSALRGRNSEQRLRKSCDEQPGSGDAERELGAVMVADRASSGLDGKVLRDGLPRRGRLPGPSKRIG